MKKEEFENIAEDIIINAGDHFEETTPNLSLGYDFVMTATDEKGNWLYHIVADKEDDKVEIIEEKKGIYSN